MSVFFVFIASPSMAQDDFEEDVESVDTGRGLSILDSIQLALSRNPNIQMQELQIQVVRGHIQQAKGIFDLTFNSSVSQGSAYTPLLSETRDQLQKQEDEQKQFQLLFKESGPPFSTIASYFFTDEASSQKIRNAAVTHTRTFSFSSEKRFETGILFSPVLEVTQVEQQAFNPKDDPDPLSQGTLSFVFRIPVLQGWGSDVNGIGVKSAESSERSSIFDLQHTNSEAILQTAIAYWDYCAAQKILEIQKESKDQADLFLEQLKILVKEGERPKTDLKQLTANLADKLTNVIAAEQQLLDSRQQLGITIGLPFKQISTLPPTTDTFPEVPEDLNLDQQIYIDYALKRRADLKALRERKHSSELIKVAAQKNVKPQLDTTVSFGAIGITKGNGTGDIINSVLNNQAGPNVLGTVSFRWPIANNTAYGMLESATASYQQAAISIRHLKRTIRSGVVRRISGLLSTIKKYRQSEFAVAQNREAVEIEREKLKLGFSTTLNVTVAQDRLTSALMGFISIQREYALSLLLLRYETATLVDLADDRYIINREHMFSVPFVE
ncbi:TolC family protein [Deltaproteobacteria bacterium TL4]